jgi:hypothetical protein
MTVPAIVVTLPVEGTATARLRCRSVADENRIAVDLCGRDVLVDVLEAIAELCERLALDDDEAAS